MRTHSAESLQEAASALTDMWTPSAASVPRRPPSGYASHSLAEAAEAAAVCGYAGCHATSWRFWRRSRRPAIDGQWGCSRSCLDALVGRSLSNELSESDTEDLAHKHRMPLGLVLLAQGWVTLPQLQHALASQRAAGRGRIGDWLVEASEISPVQVTRGLGVQWGCPVLSANGFVAARMSLVMPPLVREQMGAVPVRLVAGRNLYIGFSGSVDAAAAFKLERMTGLSVESGVLGDSDAAACTEQLKHSQAVHCIEEIVSDMAMLPARLAAVLRTAQPVESRVARIGNLLWLRMWLEPATMAAEGMLPISVQDVEDRVFHLPPAGRRSAALSPRDASADIGSVAGYAT